MADYTVAEIDERIEALRRIAKDVTRTVEDRRLARACIDGYLDQRIEAAKKVPA